MEPVDLYAVYLGGKPQPGRMGEDHEVVFVVAGNPADARKLAKAKWTGFGDPHVDAVQKLDLVDGWAVSLHPTDVNATPSPVDDTYSP